MGSLMHARKSYFHASIMLLLVISAFLSCINNAFARYDQPFYHASIMLLLSLYQPFYHASIMLLLIISAAVSNFSYPKVGHRIFNMCMIYFMYCCTCCPFLLYIFLYSWC